MNTYLITGSSSGIGRAITEKLLEQGDRVIGLARHHEKFAPQNAEYITYTIDFSDTKNIETQLKQIQKNHPEINGLICAAGFGQFNEIEQFSWAQMQNMMQVNFLSQALVTKMFLPTLKKTIAAKIIFLGSEAALHGAKKGSMYCASKFALRGFAQSLRQECSSANVAVTIINPGFVATPFFDSLKFTYGDAPDNAIQPEHIADMVLHTLNLPNECVIEEINCQPMKKVIVTKS